MKKFSGIVLTSLFALSGCEIIEHGPPKPVPVSNSQADATLCVMAKGQQEISHNCDLMHWLSFWVKHDELSWPVRRELIDQLGESPEHLLKKILLSQAKATPYQNRLRAQGWADQMLPMMSSQMQDLFHVLIYQPSQERLEFESALTILTRINTNQSKALDAQEQKLEEQQQQIDKLLKIEASMMEKR